MSNFPCICFWLSLTGVMAENKGPATPGLGLLCPELLVGARVSHWAVDAWPGLPSSRVPGLQCGGSGRPPLLTADPCPEGVRASLTG